MLGGIGLGLGEIARANRRDDRIGMRGGGLDDRARCDPRGAEQTDPHHMRQLPWMVTPTGLEPVFSP